VWVKKVPLKTYQDDDINIYVIAGKFVATLIVVVTTLISVGIFYFYKPIAIIGGVCGAGYLYFLTNKYFTEKNVTRITMSDLERKVGFKVGDIVRGKKDNGNKTLTDDAVCKVTDIFEETSESDNNKLRDGEKVNMTLKLLRHKVKSKRKYINESWDCNGKKYELVKKR
jgi:hypothetical protein